LLVTVVAVAMVVTVVVAVVIAAALRPAAVATVVVSVATVVVIVATVATAAMAAVAMAVAAAPRLAVAKLPRPTLRLLRKLPRPPRPRLRLPSLISLSETYRRTSFAGKLLRETLLAGAEFSPGSRLQIVKTEAGSRMRSGFFYRLYGSLRSGRRAKAG
jgi:hypothetical protein